MKKLSKEEIKVTVAFILSLWVSVSALISDRPSAFLFVPLVIALLLLISCIRGK